MHLNPKTLTPFSWSAAGVMGDTPFHSTTKVGPELQIEVDQVWQMSMHWDCMKQIRHAPEEGLARTHHLARVAEEAH